MVFENAGDRSPPSGKPPPQVLSHAIPAFNVPFLSVVPAPSVEVPVAVLSEAAAAVGHVTLMPAMDGTLRRVPTLIQHGERAYPSFSLQVARVYNDIPMEEIEVTENTLGVGYADIPISQTGEVLLNWTTTDLNNAFPIYSVADVIRGDVGERELSGKAVLVGLTGEGLDDKAFPFGVTLPGVILHATFLDNFFTVNFLEIPGWGITLELGLFLVLSVVAILLFPRLPTPILLGAAPVLVLGVLGLSLYLFITQSIWWPPLYPCLAVAFPFAATVFFKLRSTEKAKEVEVAKVLDAEEKLAEAQLEKGLAFQEKGSLDLAIATFNRLPMKEEMKTIYLNLGFDFQNRGKYEKAFLCYKRVFDMDPGFEDVADRLEAMRRAGVGTQLVAGQTVPPVIPQQTGAIPTGAPDISSVPTLATGARVPPTSHAGAGASYAPTGAPGVTQTAPAVEPQPGAPPSRYRLVKSLGRGAMGEVTLMVDTKLDRKVAIKMIRPDVDMSSKQTIEMRHRFVREAKTAGKLTHPNIVTIYDSFEGADGVAYIVMEYVLGDTLKNYMTKVPLTVPQIKHVVMNVANGLQFAHDNGVFHRDVKPDNIMISPKTGVVKVMDFGIARLVESNMTATGSVLGTPAYMSPEQVTGRKIDGRSDVFSLGVVLFELLVGRRPFTGSTPTSVMFAVVQNETPIPSSLGVERQVNPNWDPVVAKALAKKPEDRYQAVRQLGEAVRSVRAK
jgi:serine/threonine-protein kinase